MKPDFDVQIADLGDNYADSAGLIADCVSYGVFQWHNPLFRDHLHFHILKWVCRHQTFTRGVLCARFLSEVMPDDVDDKMKAYFGRLGRGEVAEGDPALACYWPPALMAVWHGEMFWASRQLRAGRQAASLFVMTAKVVMEKNE